MGMDLLTAIRVRFSLNAVLETGLLRISLTNKGELQDGRGWGIMRAALPLII